MIQKTVLWRFRAGYW